MQKQVLKFIIFIIVFFIVAEGFSQDNLDKKITIIAKNKTLKSVLNEISSKSGLFFSYNNQQINENQKITIVARNQKTRSVLNKLCAEIGLKYSVVEKQVILKPLTPKKQKNNNKNNNNNHNKSNNKKNIPKFTISGYVKDSSSNEVLIGATVIISDKKIAIATNSYGFYSISLPKGKYTIEFSFLGYEKKIENIYLNRNVNISKKLKLNIQELNIITISNKNVNSLSSSLLKKYNLNSTDIINKPMLGGDYDAVRSLQSIPGINLFGEGSVMFNVRGGGKGQNAIYIDEAPVYNPSHLLGFFSAIAPQAINSIKVYKSGFPVQYGGRLSSFIDFRTKDGNMKKIGFAGIFSPLLSTFSVDGPIKKKSSSFFATLRHSNLNYLFKKSNPNFSIVFRDIHLKYNKKIDRKNRIYVSFYSGYDNIKASISSMRWKNTTFSLRWNHLFSDKLFSNSTFYTSKYDYNFYYSVPNNVFWNSNIKNIAFKNDFTYYFNTKHKFFFGFDSKFRKFDPGNLNYGQYYLQRVWASNVFENVIFFGGEYRIKDKLSFNYGLRFNNWNNIGPTRIFTFDDQYNVSDTLDYGFEIFNSFNRPELRLSLLWLATKKSSFKLAFDNNLQFLHYISNSISPFTTLDVWLPASMNFEPQYSRQITAAYSLNLPEIFFAIETYYKKMYNQIDFSNQPDVFLNPYLRNQLRFGNLNAVGIEFLIEKQKGNFKFSTSYTLSRAIRQTVDLNNNNPYPAIWDKPHNFYTNIAWQTGDRTTLNASFFYISGNRFSSPTAFYYFQNYTVPVYEQKNNDKLPDYHRLDFSVKFRFNKNQNNRYEHFILFSIYNLYGRNNVISVNFNKIQTENGNFYVPSDYVSEREIMPTTLSLLGFIPTISYHFKFR